MMLGALFIIGHQPDERAHGRRLDAALAIFCADLKRQPPLLEQHTVSGKQTVLRIIDVRRFRSHTVQLDDLEVPALLELIYRWRAHVKASKIKTLKALADFVESLL